MASASPQEGQVTIDWPAMDELTVNLAEQIEAGDDFFDTVLVLQRGGAFVGIVLAGRLGLQADHVLSASLTSYKDGKKQPSGELVIGQFPTTIELEDKHVLVVDEVCDTGNTLKYVVDRVAELGAAAVKSAVVHHKPTHSVNGYVPDFYVEETAAWINYPWELHQDVGLLSRLNPNLEAAKDIA